MLCGGVEVLWAEATVSRHTHTQLCNLPVLKNVWLRLLREQYLHESMQICRALIAQLVRA